VRVVPFFLFGAARSGTNALTWALETSDQISVRNEDSPDCFDQFVLRDKIDIDAVLAKSAPKPVFFKSFHDTPRARCLLESYPGSRAVYLIRQPGDCIGSFVNEFGEAGARVWLQRFSSAAKERGGILLRMCRGDTIATEIAINKAQLMLEEIAISGASVANIGACYYLWAHSFAHHIGLFQDPRFLVLDYDAMVADPQVAIDRTCHHFSIERLNIDPDYWFAGRRFGKSVEISTRLLAKCEAIYDEVSHAF